MRAAPGKKAADPLKRLFWKTQIGLLYACPPIAAISRFSMGADRSRKSWVKTMFWVAAQAPRTVFLHCRDKISRRIVLPRVSLPVTTRCTLNCDKCIAHIPDIKKRRDIPSRDLLQDLQVLFSGVDYIYTLNLNGGEAFLHPELDKIIRACADSGKAGNMELTTNGTVVPDAAVLTALRDANVMVKISGYPPALQPNAAKLKQALEENGVHYIYQKSAFWYDSGDHSRLQDGLERRRFSVCAQRLCMPLYYGKLYLCSESAVLLEEGLIPDCKEDYIDLRKIDPAAFRGEWRRLRKRRAVSACSRCMGNTYETPKIPVALQRGCH